MQHYHSLVVVEMILQREGVFVIELVVQYKGVKFNSYKHHHMEDVLPVMCNCDHLAMQKLHAMLIREGTCVASDCCDYCIVGDQNPLAAQYQLVRKENGLLVSVKK